MKYFILNRNKKIRELLKEIITKEKDYTFEFENFFDAYEKLQAISPDIAFIDYRI